MSAAGAKLIRPSRLIRIIFIPSIVFMGMLAMTFFGWDLVRKDQNRQILIDTIGATEHTAARIESFISTRLSMGDHLSHAWHSKQVNGKSDFELHARSIHDLFPDIQAINWVSPDRVIRWVTPISGNEKAIGLDLGMLKIPNALLSKVMETGKVQTSSFIALAQGGLGFVSYIPVIEDDYLEGFINIVLRVEPLLAEALKDDLGDRFSFRISDGDKIAVETRRFDDAQIDSQASRDITAGSRIWMVEGQPASAHISAQNSLLDELALWGGITMSIVVSGMLATLIHRQNKLNISEEKFRRIFEQAGAGITIVDLTGRLEQANQAFLNMLGYKANEIRGRSFNEFTHPDDKEIGQDVVQALLSGSDSSPWFEKRYIHKDGHSIACEVRCAALCDVNGNPYLLTAQIQDATKRKESEAAILEAKAKAEFANKAKSEFLASMSHDLRTPLNAILGFSEMMTRHIFGPLGSDKYEEYAELIHKSGVRLVSMVNDILDLSKIESNEYTLEEVFVDVDEALRASKERCALKPSDRMEGRITVFQGGKLPLLYCDERALSQILDNLLTNALKYSEDKDKIYLSFSLGDKGEGIITVEDTGLGIIAENLEKVILPFVQSAQSNSTNPHISKQTDGIGLGLHIVSRLMELHEATIDIKSELGIGTTITLSFSMERLEKL